MFRSDSNSTPSRAHTQVSRIRRPLDRAYVALSFLFVFALAAVVFVTVIQASPSTSGLAIGWYNADSRAGASFEQRGNDSLMRSSSGPDQIGYERQLYSLINQARIEHGLA